MKLADMQRLFEKVRLQPLTSRFVIAYYKQ